MNNYYLMAQSRKKQRQVKNRRRKAYKAQARKSLRPTYMSVWPKTKLVKFSYSTNFTLASTLGTMSMQEFRANSIYDPDATGTGSSVYWMSTLCGSDNASPYSKYRVLAAKITVRAANNSTSGASFQDIGIITIPNTISTPDSIEDVINVPGSVHTLISSAYSAGGLKTLTKWASIKKVLGVSDLKDNSGTAADYNANPAQGVRFAIVAQPLDKTTSTQLNCRATIDYYCQLFQRNDSVDA